jgi:pimeloyl-ACP methyl ester carboxylesterase
MLDHVLSLSLPISHPFPVYHSPSSLSSIVRGEFLDLNGVRLYYYAAGSRGAGEPVVLLHGFPTSSHLWTGVVPLLPTGHRVVVLDLLGFGRSDPPRAASLDIRAHADRVVGVLDALGINYACIVGHDVGGGIAQSVAVRHPHRVSKLGLVNSVAFDAWPTREVKIARATLPLTRHLPPSWIVSVMRQDLLRGYVDHERGTRDIDLFLRPFAEGNGRDTLVRHLSALRCDETAALGPRLREITAPTSIICAERDPFLPVTLGQRLHEALHGSSLEIIPEARHFVPLENAHAVAASIGRLLSR